MVAMTTAVEPMNLHHAMLRSPGRHLSARRYGGRRNNKKTVNGSQMMSEVLSRRVLLRTSGSKCLSAHAGRPGKLSEWPLDFMHASKFFRFEPSGPKKDD